MTSTAEGVLSGIRAVVFDVGETLVDETRMWSELADSVGTTAFTLMAELGSLIERGCDHREVWAELGVGTPARSTMVHASDLYPDALPCLALLKDEGFVIGVAGNQPDGVVAQLRGTGVDTDFVASSATWGIAKPDRAFFRRVVDAVVDVAPGTGNAEILYVGDRLDNDILPARSVGMRTAFLVRGPWAHIQRRRPEAELADMTLSSLAELTAVLGL